VTAPVRALPPLDFQHPPLTGLVSCVIPVYNGERFVAEAIESIVAQDYPSTEIIVTDDGSTDDTATVLERFGERIRVIRQENQGPSVARNRGMEESRGEFIAFLDADDLWIPEKTRLQVEAFRARPELDLCSGEMRSFWIPELRHEEEAFADHPYHGQRSQLSPCTILARRTLFERVGPFDPELRNGEDTDWFIRMVKAGAVYEALPQLILHRRQHTSNLTRAYRAGYDGVLDLLKRSLDRGRAR
jgi:glycosyltransferase involved in cell wall biosynthesis